jgi:hypothetical protein
LVVVDWIIPDAMDYTGRDGIIQLSTLSSFRE